MPIEESIEIVKSIKSKFDGKDPIAELSARMQNMSATQLRKMVLVGCNQVGTCIKNGDYVDVYDSVLHLNMGASMILTAYDDAVVTVLSEQNMSGNS